MIRVAHVGVCKQKDSEERQRWDRSDEIRNTQVCEWLLKNDPDLGALYASSGTRTDVEIDLENKDEPRDFLTDGNTYDIVITHNVYSNPPLNPVSDYWDKPGITQLSRLHSPDEWRNRFQNCGAKYIFIYGDDMSGRYVGNIPKYREVYKGQDKTGIMGLSIYIREDYNPSQ
jgi:hypothetical protein